MKKTKWMLFVELANSDNNGISRWVNTNEFVGDYSILSFGNGGSWCRRNSSLCKRYNISVDKTITPGNSIDRIKLNGFNKDKNIFSQYIKKEIKDVLSKKKCCVLNISNVEIDHKNGRKDDILVSNSKTQELNDFQPMSKAVNDAKRQHCKVCKRTNKRFDAKNLGYNISVVVGDVEYDKEIGCIGCYWNDTIFFNSKLSLK